MSKVVDSAVKGAAFGFAVAFALTVLAGIAVVVGIPSSDRHVHTSDNALAQVQLPNEWPVIEPPAKWDQPARVQVEVHESWVDGASNFAGILILFGLPAFIFVVLFAMRRKKSVHPSDEGVLVHELVRRAEDLSQRMEALETILLDRTRVTR